MVCLMLFVSNGLSAQSAKKVDGKQLKAQIQAKKATKFQTRSFAKPNIAKKNLDATKLTKAKVQGVKINRAKAQGKMQQRTLEKKTLKGQTPVDLKGQMKANLKKRNNQK